MKDSLLLLKEKSLDSLSKAESIEELNELKVKYLGKKGELTQILRGMASISPEERPEICKLANDIKQSLEQKFTEKSTLLKQPMDSAVSLTTLP